jgi:hypothetical protein
LRQVGDGGDEGRGGWLSFSSLYVVIGLRRRFLGWFWKRAAPPRFCFGVLVQIRVFCGGGGSFFFLTDLVFIVSVAVGVVRRWWCGMLHYCFCCAVMQWWCFG